MALMLYSCRGSLYFHSGLSVFGCYGRKAMALIGKNIRRFVANRGDMEAAEAMMVGSLFAGIAFSFARLGNVHAMSHPVSAFSMCHTAWPMRFFFQW